MMGLAVENQETVAPLESPKWQALREVRFVFSLDGSLVLWAPLAYYEIRRAPTGSLAVQHLEIAPLGAEMEETQRAEALSTDLRITTRPNGSMALIVPLANYDVVRNYPSGSLGSAPTVERIVIAPRFARGTAQISGAHNRDTLLVNDEASNGSL